MPTCKNCNRYISSTNRISDNGIKYVCRSDEDVKKCSEIMYIKKQNEFNEDQLKLSKIKKLTNVTIVINIFYTIA